MQPTVVSKILAAASANCISTSQTPGAAGDLTITGSAASGGVATLDTQRAVLVTTEADESLNTLTIYGTDGKGNVISEVMTGPNHTTGATNLQFKTVTRVAVSAAFSDTVTVGTNGVGATKWSVVNYDFGPVNVAWSVVIGGTSDYTIQYTLDNIQTMSPSTVPTVWPVATTSPTSLSGATSSATGSISTPFVAWRLLVNSGTVLVTATAVQAGIRN